ncbi:MAG: four helix bundle protein [Alphaproteobacteria bacterium]|nr:four helix bundle protein [Alphaproteobacteria bacterium]
MSRSDTLPIFLESYKLLVELYKVTTNFPREYKFSLGQDIQKDTMELFRCIYRANSHQDKVPYLEDFAAWFEAVRLEIRLAHDLNIISQRKYAQLSLMMENIGKQSNAWRKHEKVRLQKKIETQQSHAEP